MEGRYFKGRSNPESQCLGLKTRIFGGGLRNRGLILGIGRGTVLAFNDPNLQNCDRRVASANSYCPDCGDMGL